MIKVVVLFSFIFLSYSSNAKSFPITDFGAVSDTTRLSTVAINKAIAACYQSGGGMVVVPAGKFKSGTIVLKDNVELFLERGATLYASTDTLDFPRQAQPAYRSQKDPGGWYALIYAEGATNIAISGAGTIDGQGANQIPRRGELTGDRDGRPRNVLFISCKNVSVSGFTMLNAGIWNQHYLNCEDVLVNNIRVFNHSNRNNDGIDIDGCRRFVLSNSIIDSDDDGIVLKSTGPAPCEDVVINNCIVSSFTNAIKCGTESTGGFKNIAISNCTVRPSSSKIKSVFKAPDIGINAISLEIVDGGIMDGLSISNIVVDGTECPIYVRLGNRARRYKDDAPEPSFGQMRNICIANITARSAGNYGCSITGVPGAAIENISLTNIRLLNRGGLNAGDYITKVSDVKEDEKGYPEPTVWKNLPAYGFFIRHVRSIALHDISLGSKNKEQRLPLIVSDVQQLFVRNFTVDQSAVKIPFQLLNVREKHISDSTVEVTNGN